MQYCQNMVRQDDLERYYATLFAPAGKQADLWALFAFNQEVAKTRESVSEPMIGEIRLQWWREALDGITAGTPREHPVVQGLCSIVTFDKIQPLLDEVIDGRAQDLELEGSADIEGLSRYADQVGGALSEAAAIILAPGAHAADRALARASGRAWAMLGILRALPYQVQDAKDFSVTGATTQGFGGMSVPEIEQRLAPLVAEMHAYVRTEIKQAAHKPEARALRPILALNGLAKLHLRALESAGGSVFTMAQRESSNLRKLVALTMYHVF